MLHKSSRVLHYFPCFEQRLEVSDVGRTLHPHCLVFVNFNKQKNYGCPALNICLILCFDYFCSNNFVVSVFTFPKKGAIPKKQAISSPVLFIFHFICKLKKTFALLPRFIRNEIFSSNSALDWTHINLSRLMQIHVLGFWTVRWDLAVRLCWCEFSGYHCRDRDLSIENSLQDRGTKANAFGLKHN